MAFEQSKIRMPKDNDQEKIAAAWDLLLDLIKTHQNDIEPALWVAAMIGSLSENYEKSGVRYKDFKKLISNVVSLYKY